MAGVIEGAESFLVTPQQSPGGNVGTLIRAASAFNASELVLVGHPRFASHGAHGAQKHVHVTYAIDWAETAEYLREERNCIDIIAVVPPSSPMAGKTALITQAEEDNTARCAAAVPVHTRPFRGSTAFILAVRPGIAEEVEVFCDRFMYVPQYMRPLEIKQNCVPSIDDSSNDNNDGGTHGQMRQPAVSTCVTLDMSTVACIVLQHFASWACFHERGSVGHKFIVSDVHHRRERKGVATRVKFADERNAVAGEGKHHENTKQTAGLDDRDGGFFFPGTLFDCSTDDDGNSRQAGPAASLSLSGDDKEDY